MEGVKKDLFKVSLGNVPPQREIQVNLKYVVELAAVTSSSVNGIDWLEFAVPSSTLCCTGDNLVENGIQIKVNATHVGEKLLLIVSNQVNVEMPSVILNIESPYYPLSSIQKPEEHVANIIYDSKQQSQTEAQQKVSLEEDFVLRISTKQIHESVALVEADEKGNQLSLYTVS